MIARVIDHCAIGNFWMTLVIFGNKQKPKDPNFRKAGLKQKILRKNFAERNFVKYFDISQNQFPNAETF